jgi:mannose-6-phosphate isomerase-like protein (cupin superfamily)
LYFYNFNEIGFKRKRDKVFIKSITGQQSQLCLIRIEPEEITEHAHRQEQIGIVLSGELEIVAGKETRILRKGEGYFIPSNVHHSFRVVGQSPVEYIEVFTPPKDENRTE